MQTSASQQSDDIDHLPTREGYDRWAEIYDGEGNPLVTLEQPHVDCLLGEISPGLTIADIGCGTGRHALRLAQRGAKVTALDFSSKMLNKAREKLASLTPGSPQIHFVEHDLSHRLPLSDRSFDRVLCSLVMDHIADLPGLFAELGRVCRPDGFVVISTMHPALMLRGVQARFTDPNTGRETRPASLPHQICDYVMAAIPAGLNIDHLSEHRVDAELARTCPRAEKYLDWPLLLMMRVRP
jgi:ubiquinone/menaquinone biosynthesis C-methylase UbiE